MVIKGDTLGGLEIRDIFVIESDLFGDSAFGICTSMENTEESSDTHHVLTADELIEEAREQAAELIAAAQVEADAIRSDAYKLGYDDGYNVGLNALEGERSSFHTRIAEIEKEIETQVEESWRSIEPEILDLSVDIARKIVREEITLKPEIVLKMIKHGITQIKDRQEIRLHVNPSSYELVRGHKEEILSSCDGIRNLEVVDDRRVGVGECMIETSNGNLDARVETQLSEVRRVLQEELKNGAVDEADQAE